MGRFSDDSSNYSVLASKADELAAFLQRVSSLSECHLVDFITHDLFTKLLPADLAANILALSDAELAVLPGGELIDILTTTSTAADRRAESHAASPLIEFLRSCRRFFVERLLTYDDDDESMQHHRYFANAGDVCAKGKLKLSYCTDDKKSHEIEEMASAVATMADSLRTRLVIDIGSGRGYLGSLLAMYYGLWVRGFDASDQNTHSATRRLEKVQKEWHVTLRRAAAIVDEEKSTNNSATIRSEGLYTPITCAVGSSTKLDDFLTDKEDDEAGPGDPIVICGLHTCGDLASNALRMYAECGRAKGLVLLGCCYHLIEERFATNLFKKDGDASQSDFYGFPLSSYLRERGFAIGRNTRILSSQPVNKMTVNTTLPNKSLFWRALVQQIVWDKLQHRVDIFERRVGKVASKCKNFEDYVPRAFKNLGLDIEMEVSEIQRYEFEYAQYEQKLKAFFQLRCALAKPVETMILLDRLLYLLEQDCVIDAKIVPLFDPAISPRCYAIVCRKR